MSTDLLYDVDAEESVIGSVMINPDCFMELSQIVTESDFYIARNGMMWRVFKSLASRGMGIDNITVTAELQDLGLLDEVGSSYPLTMITRTPTSIHGVSYANIVADLGLRRRIVLAASKSATVAYDRSVPIQEVISQSVRNIQETVVERSRERSIGELVAEHGKISREKSEQPDAQLGIRFGIRSIDRQLGLGLQTKLMLVAGRPGVGKTSLALQLVISAARQGKSSAIFSFEMEEQEVVNALLSIMTGIDSQRLMSGKLTDEEKLIYRDRSDELKKLDKYIHLFVCPAESFQYIRSKCLGLQAKGSLDLVVVDYLMLINDYSKLEENDRANHLTRDFKRLKGELRCAFVVIHHMNRSIEHRGDGTPRLSDLNEGGERDPDIIVFVYPTQGVDVVNQDVRPITAWFCKHRGGPTGAVNLIFNAPCTTFFESYRGDTGKT